ncbi:MAG: hypothetical protein V4732_02450 [Pseudomonadota bacterium]
MKENFCCTWITWEKQIRNRSLSQKFNAQLYEFDYHGNQLARYSKCIFNTIGVLYKRRNGVVFVQTPSIALALLALFMRPFLRYMLIIDAHNAGIFPEKKWLMHIAELVLKKADFTIVTNQRLADIISSKGGSALIIPDPLPTFHDQKKLMGMEIEHKNVLFICSWANDEPYFEVFKTAESLQDFSFFVTGRSKGKEQGYGKPLPKNIVLTGYLSDDDYHKKLATSGIIVDLTTRDDCLVCGAYEATALERPFIVSNKKAIREYFKKGCVYVENTTEDITHGITLMVEQHNELKKQVVLGRTEIETNWNLLFEKTKVLIANKRESHQKIQAL